MVQFYFLSIVINVFVGLILVYGKNFTNDVNVSIKVKKDESKVHSTTKRVKKEEKIEEQSVKHNPIKDFECVDNKTFRLVTGILCAFVGIMKLLTVFKNDVPFIGDLFPAVVGLAGAVSLLLEYYLVTTTEETELPEWVSNIFIKSRKYIGIACLTAALLHFVFPQVVLL